MRLGFLILTILITNLSTNLKAQERSFEVFHHFGYSESLFKIGDIQTFAISNQLELSLSDYFSTSTSITLGRNRSNEYTPEFSYNQFDLNLHGSIFKKSKRINVKLSTGIVYLNANGRTAKSIFVGEGPRVFTYENIELRTWGLNMNTDFIFTLTEKLALSLGGFYIPYLDENYNYGVKLKLITKI